MNENHGNGFPVARVIAVLDASSTDIEPVTAAAEVAARLGAEVLGLFIEDINLVRLACLPAARHVGIGLSASDTLDIDSLEREMQAFAAEAKATLDACATQTGVKWSFRTVRGLPAEELETATVMQDLLVLGSARATPGLPLRFGSPVREAAWQLARTVLFVPRRATLVRPLVVARAGSQRTIRAMAACGRFAQRRDLDIMLVGNPGEVAGAAAEIDVWMKARGYSHRLYTRATLTASQLAQLCQAIGTDGLILTSDLPLVDAGDGFDELARAAGRHVLVVR